MPKITNLAYVYIKFVEVMQKTLWPLLFPDNVYLTSKVWTDR